MLRSGSLTAVMPRLDSLLMVLKTCRGWQCTKPWTVLHPEGDVRNLGDALNPVFDEFYDAHWLQERVEFTKCEKGYIAEVEWPKSQGKSFPGFMDDEIAVIMG